MFDPILWFREGGPFIWLILILASLGLPAVGVALGLAGISRVRPDQRTVARVLSLLVLAFSLTVPLAGAVGWVQNRGLTDGAVANAPPEYADRIREQGYAISLYPVYAGLFACLFGLLPATAAVGLAFAPGAAVDPEA